VKAVDANLLELLKKSTQFVVPIYQRVYSWGPAECEQLWSDVLRAGRSDDLGAHFTGSIVYVEKGQGTRTSSEPDLIIDGQQRVTTVTLLLSALAARLETLPDDQQEPVDGFSPKKIRGLYLTNEYEEGDRFFKLVLSQADKDALKAIIRQAPVSSSMTSRVLTNYTFLTARLAHPEIDLTTVCLGLKKLIVVDVKLTRGVDNPQLVFEAMNSTGKKLSQADLIRNYVLMDLPPTAQGQLYEDYWFPMESEFKGSDEPRFDEFVRHYLTLKTGSIPRLGDIYDAFKDYAEEMRLSGGTRADLAVDLSTHAQHFVAMALGKEEDRELTRAFAEIEQLRATVVYPFLLRMYADYSCQLITRHEFLGLLTAVISYLFRRAVCRIPTNSLNKTFAGFGSFINPEKYVESAHARFLTLNSYKRFPSDAEFEAALQTEDLYHFQRTPYFFRKMENHGRKEQVSTADYTIEHILPQNENLSAAWRAELGSDWRAVQERYLHTLGNLTLTGYNPEYSDRAFADKRDMEGGFRHSPLRLNQGLGQLTTWNESTITVRAATLAKQAVGIWPMPALPDSVLADYRANLTQASGFDWSLAHDILARLPAGRWTGYYHLAEAIGTSAQAVANHVSRCSTCVAPYRVLTWDGRIAEGFAWTDPNDTRDPQQALEVEGVVFALGMANPEQKLVVEDLLALAED
jgi:uncharacterized protein with ParB-like and HNH nuclease domain/alkylated DNA nucleotide flippase Atl1